MGFIEADTEANCGESLSRTFVYTIDAVNIAADWTKQRAIWEREKPASWRNSRRSNNHSRSFYNVIRPLSASTQFYRF
jgi:hypothetical protein